MSTILDLKIIPKVRAALRKVGRTITFVTYPAKSQDNDLSEVTAGTSTDVVVYSTPLINYDNNMVNGDTILVDDCYIIVLPESTSGVAFVPTTQMLVNDGVLTWSIVAVRNYAPGFDAAAYEVQLRRSQ